MPHTTGDLEFDPVTNTYRPIGTPAIMPYAPAALLPQQELDVRASMRAELERQGLPIPAHLIDPPQQGGQAELRTEGAEAELRTEGAVDGDDGELEQRREAAGLNPASDDRIAELEAPKHDTDRPPPRRRR